jgi:hypothetical protein
MDVRHVERLRRARDLLAVKGFDTQHAVLACYSGAGFDPELQAGQRPDIRLVGLDQLYAARGASLAPLASLASRRRLAYPTHVGATATRARVRQLSESNAG